MFPTIVRMEQLESLYIRYCHESLVLPEIQANMECLVKLDVSDIEIDALLSSIGECCTNLIYLNLVECFNLNSIEVKFDELKCLKEFSGSKGREKTPFPLPLTCSLRKLDLGDFCFQDGPLATYSAQTPQPVGLQKACKIASCLFQCNDFCGFLIGAVLEDHVPINRSPCITIKEEASDDMCGMLHDEVWRESFCGKVTWVCLGGSFGGKLTWEWDRSKSCSHEQWSDTSTDSSEFTDDYTPKISIRHHSKSSLRISPDVYRYF
ncbi:Toll/interleukin-1 receptor domain-containing protein [Tanacetum coccineum]